MNETRRLSPECPAPDGSADAIELAHGGGGLKTQRLIDGLFRPAFGVAPEDFTHDGAAFEIDGARLAFTTDSYVVRPLFFPGGDIGALAVNGTVNDLAMCGAEPLYLSAAFVIEEGFAIKDLARVVRSMQEAAQIARVRLITGDTKVVERGKGDGLYVTTSGVGRIIAPGRIVPQSVKPGDAVIVSGDIARHGIAIMAAREALGFESIIESDCAPLADAVGGLLQAGIDIHCLRDLTRGGLATALIEIAETAKVVIRLNADTIPVSAPVRGACEILGLDPLYVANEGRFVALLPAAAAQAAVEILRKFNPETRVIGRVAAHASYGELSLTTIGGERVLDLSVGDQLPRIC